MHLTLRSALFCIPLLIATGAGPTFAQGNLTYICTLNEASRVISVEYPTTESLPCSVTYTKDDKPQTLWQAENNEGYCEQKAREFVEQQKNWGWQCANDNVVTVGDVAVGGATVGGVTVGGVTAGDVTAGDVTAGENVVTGETAR